jgi:hypothetical protein
LASAHHQQQVSLSRRSLTPRREDPKTPPERKRERSEDIDDEVSDELEQSQARVINRNKLLKRLQRRLDDRPPVSPRSPTSSPLPVQNPPSPRISTARTDTEPAPNYAALAAQSRFRFNIGSAIPPSSASSNGSSSPQIDSLSPRIYSSPLLQSGQSSPRSPHEDFATEWTKKWGKSHDGTSTPPLDDDFGPTLRPSARDADSDELF